MKRKDRRFREGHRANEVGKLSEHIVSMALQMLKGENRITSFIRVNEPGRDFVVTLLDGSKKAIEVKSSYLGRYLHQLHYGKDATPVIIVRHDKRKMKDSLKNRLAMKAKPNILDLIIPVPN